MSLVFMLLFGMLVGSLLTFFMVSLMIFDKDTKATSFNGMQLRFVKEGTSMISREDFIKKATGRKF